MVGNCGKMNNDGREGSTPLMSMEPAEAFGKYCGEKICTYSQNNYLSFVRHIHYLNRKFNSFPLKENFIGKTNKSFINKFEKRTNRTNKVNLSIQSRRKLLFFSSHTDTADSLRFTLPSFLLFHRRTTDRVDFQSPTAL